MKKGNELNTIDFPPQNWQPSSIQNQLKLVKIKVDGKGFETLDVIIKLFYYCENDFFEINSMLFFL